MTITAGDRLELDPRVSLRPERFGALAYHFGTRKLSFLKHPDLVRVVESLAEHPTVGDALVAAGVEPDRWPSFLNALGTLEQSEMLRAA
jgi:putative mycofactocin binding protein MftB